MTLTKGGGESEKRQPYCMRFHKTMSEQKERRRSGYNQLTPEQRNQKDRKGQYKTQKRVDSTTGDIKRGTFSIPRGGFSHKNNNQFTEEVGENVVKLQKNW